MSKHETPMIRWYWEQVGGTLVEEFMAVPKGNNNSRRLVDGIIIRDGENRIADAKDVDLFDRDIIVIQAKAKRLGMYLMGQTIFSAKLMIPFKPRTILSVALCDETDSILAPMMEAIPNTQIVVYPRND